MGPGQIDRSNPSLHHCHIGRRTCIKINCRYTVVIVSRQKRNLATKWVIQFCRIFATKFLQAVYIIKLPLLYCGPAYTLRIAWVFVSKIPANMGPYCPSMRCMMHLPKKDTWDTWLLHSISVPFTKPTQIKLADLLVVNV